MNLHVSFRCVSGARNFKLVKIHTITFDLVEDGHLEMEVTRYAIGSHTFVEKITQSLGVRVLLINHRSIGVLSLHHCCKMVRQGSYNLFEKLIIQKVNTPVQ